MTKKTQSWYAIKWRSLSSFFLVFSSLVILVSGIVLYIAPIGRYAHSVDWKILWLDKGQWEALHTLFSFVAVFFSVLHLILNWKVLVNYLWNRVKRVYFFPKELTISLLLTLVITVGTILYVPPFSTVMDWGETFSASWEANAAKSLPVGTTLPESSATEIVDEVPPAISGGWGRYTVAELCAQENVDVRDALARLQTYGIEADAETRIRTLADTTKYEPSEIVDILLGQPLGTVEAGEEH